MIRHVAMALLAVVIAAGCSAGRRGPQRWQGVGLSIQQERVCADGDDAGACARAIEAKRWSELDRLAERKDSALVLRLADGKERRLQDKAAEGVRYSLIDYVRSADSFVVFEQSRNASTHLLIRRADGGSAKIDSAPVFSPDGAYFVTTSTDKVRTPAAIRVYRTAANASKPRMEWSLEPGTWGPGLPRWLDETTIQIPTDGRAAPIAEGEKVPSELTVKRSTAGVWYAVLSFEGSTAIN
ncbi:MAG TPA: hypothetical protein VEL28_16695 [Candidatus Binatia bacterium]|nr:hypothetical protein [Candidatus Binatia bacterium]